MHEVWSQEPHCYRVLLDEKCLSCKTEVYLLYLLFSENCLWSDLQDFLMRPYAALSLRVTVACFASLVVFILRFVKTGTRTLLSFPNIRSDPAP